MSLFIERKAQIFKCILNIWGIFRGKFFIITDNFYPNVIYFSLFCGKPIKKIFGVKGSVCEK